MVIKFTNYPDGVHNFTMNKSAIDLGLPDFFIGDINVECKLDKSMHQLVLDCDVVAEANLICDRCTSEFSRYLEGNFQLTYLFSTDTNRKDDLNLLFLAKDEDKIDISSEVLDYAVLMVPVKKLCNEDCKGLCPMCGINHNEENCDCTFEINDSVWEPLKKLKKN